MTLDHGRLGPEDVRTVLRTGVSKPAIQDALEVAFLFNIYDRLADTMGWHVPAVASGYYQVAARRLIKHGYGLAVKGAAAPPPDPRAGRS